MPSKSKKQRNYMRHLNDEGEISDATMKHFEKIVPKKKGGHKHSGQKKRGGK